MSFVDINPSEKKDITDNVKLKHENVFDEIFIDHVIPTPEDPDYEVTEPETAEENEQLARDRADKASQAAGEIKGKFDADEKTLKETAEKLLGVTLVDDIAKAAKKRLNGISRFFFVSVFPVLMLKCQPDSRTQKDNVQKS